jgi:hypothetical protein
MAIAQQLGPAPVEDQRWPALLLRWLPFVILATAIAVRTARIFGRQRYVLVNDQIQHIVPYRHFLPNLQLPRDYIIDYFITQNSFLYGWLYIVPAKAGIEPTAVAAVLALSSLAAALVFAYAIIRAAGGSLAAAAATTTIVLMVLCGKDDIAIGSARSLGWPLCAGALWAIVGDRDRWFMVFGGVAALIYPPVAVVVLGTLGLYVLADFAARRDLAYVRRWAAALALVFAVLLLSAVDSSSWGPTITEAQAKLLPEFLEGGRSAYYSDSAEEFYLYSVRSGLIDPRLVAMWHLPVLAIAAFFLRPPGQLLRLAVALALASVMLWGLAHLLLYRLYLPGRYPSYGLVLATVLMAGWTLGVIADRVRGGAWIVAVVLVAWPAWLFSTTYYPDFALDGAHAPTLLERIKAHPGHGAVAGIARPLDYVTAVTGRPVAWSREIALPYQLGYRAEVARQLNVAADAIFASRPETLLRWAGANSIEWIMVDDEVFTKGAQARLVATTPGGVSVAKRHPSTPDSWLGRQTDCAMRESNTQLFDVACLKQAADAAAVAAVPG